MHPWKKIEAWLEEYVPEVLEDLNGPATIANIRATESAMSVKLPKDMVDAYRIHDGQDGGAPPVGGDWQVLRLKTVVKQWKILKVLLDKGTFATADADVKAVGPVRPVWWNARWIPFGFAANGDLICVDLDPAKGGTVGQIIVFLHDNEVRTCVAKSLTKWLDQLASDLAKGKVVIGAD
jgi:cell wall assembly regulator SMI1